MGGKREDQYAREAGAEVPDDSPRRADEHILDEAKSKVAESRAAAHESKIPKAGKNPALAELQAVRERRAAEDAADDATTR